MGKDAHMGGSNREVLEYIKPFGGEYEIARLVKTEKYDRETGGKEMHVGLEIKLEDGRWFYKTGIGRYIGTDTD